MVNLVVNFNHVQKDWLLIIRLYFNYVWFGYNILFRYQRTHLPYEIQQVTKSLIFEFKIANKSMCLIWWCGRRAGLRVDHSPNLFIENLHNTPSLETIYYVTDIKQQTDFFWYRDSGIRINIGLQNVNVLPVYDDVEHGGGGDTNFMTGSPHSDRDKNRFNEIVGRYCRWLNACLEHRMAASMLLTVLSAKLTIHLRMRMWH